MSILTAIFQAIGQALTWVLPISESGHSAIFHDFSGRFTNACSQLTGVIHIGIALGIIAGFHKLFLHLAKNFFQGWNELFRKKLDIKKSSQQRKFMYMTILSFVPMLIYLLPAGRYSSVFSLFHRTSYNGSLIGEGICFAFTGLLLISVSGLLEKRNNPFPQILQAIILGITAFFAVPSAGSSLVAGVFCIALIVGMNDKSALRYSMVMSSMVLFVSGIIELCTGVTKIGVAPAVIALVVSAVTAFFAVKILIFTIKNNYLKFFAIYDISIGIICLVIGVFEVVIK